MNNQASHATYRLTHGAFSRDVWRRRLLAVLAVTLVASSAPATPVFATTAPNKPAEASHVNRADKQAMRQDYPTGLPVVQSRHAVAGDVGRPGSPLLIQGQDGSSIAVTPGEIADRRTATTVDLRNADGTVGRRQYFAPQHYQHNGQWIKIDSRLIADTNPYDLSQRAQRIEQVDRTSSSTAIGHLRVAGNDWHARFAPSDFAGGLLRLQLGASQVGFVPVGARAVSPTMTIDQQGKQVVRYSDLWPGVDVEYIVYGSEVKENVVLKHRDAASSVSFRVLGATLAPGKEGFIIKGALKDEFHITPINLILNTFGVVSDTSVYRQVARNGVLTVSVDRAYLSALPDEAFPAIIDPGMYRSPFGTRVSGNYMSFKSDGYVCPSHVCNPMAGSVLDASYVWRNWRGALHSPYHWFQDPNKRLVNANLHLTMRLGLSVSGTTDPKWIDAWHATCHSYGCIGMWGGETYMGTVGDINLTGLYQNRIAAGDWGAWIMLTGEENVPWTTYKNFDPDNSYVDFHFYDPPPAPGIAVPAIDQTFIDPQVSFRLNGVGNPNNGDPLEYELVVSSGPGGVGTVISSGLIGATQWTIPDGMLQDGSTYYVQARSFDNTGGGWGSWSGSVPFKVDMRTGKDATQTFDTVGPISVDLASGNLITSLSSHSSAALGGGLGISLDYNSPLRSRQGLVGEYWNNGSFSGNASLTRLDQNIDFNWESGSPASSTIGTDNFTVRWKGFFVPPLTGSYQFGSSHDDGFSVWINDQVVHTTACCSGAPAYNGNPVTLQAGQPAKITVDFAEGPGHAMARLWVKGAVPEQIVPKEWLQTGIRPMAQNRGLIGRYFHDNGSHDFNQASLFMQRTDPLVSFGWDLGTPTPGGPGDNFLVRWTGYLAVPVTGNYELGSVSDDGVRIKINYTDEVQANWTDHGVTETYGASRHLTAGQAVPITVEYYEHGGGATIYLKIKSDSLGVPAQIVPSTWLSPSARVLPDGWSLGIDPDGDLSYDRLSARQNSAVLTDATGSTHEYTWTGSGYKPPVNEDGHLVRNNDGTFTLQDVDGRTYVFSAEGSLTSVTSPVDARKPAALRYFYAGTPPRITQITDGVTNDRWAKVFYSGAPECGSAPASFDSQAPADMLCALQTNDRRSTYFYYKHAQLARVAEPGSELTDFQYEQLPDGLFRIASIRDTAANDAIAAGVRANDENVLTQVTYDVLGRVASVIAPAAKPGDVRAVRSYERVPGSTMVHSTPGLEPNGYTDKVEYDHLLRTTKDYDLTGQSTTTEWHAIKDLTLSTTDPTGQKSTTLYDDDDRPIETYGPAPTAWFGSDRKPLTPYASQVPHSESRYDEGIIGPAVAWYNVKENGFVGAPKLHTTGYNATRPAFLSRDFRVGTLPFTPDAGMDGFGFSATGKMKFPAASTYTFHSWHDDGIRLWLDDKLVIDNWAHRSEGAAQSAPTGTFVAEANKSYRVRFDYLHVGTPGAVGLCVVGAGIVSDQNCAATQGTATWSFLRPGYNLVTSARTFDAALGDSVTSTSYGPQPELGLAHGTTLDPGGLNLTTALTYEAQGAEGSYLRQTSKTLPGGGTTSYAYYAGAETRDNPCTAQAEDHKQAGFMKLKTEPDPDGTGPQTGRGTEFVYDDAGRTIATRYNSDAWICTTYDARGRVTKTVVPQFGSEQGRTITNNWNVGGNPLVTAAGDNAGDIATAVDLLGRVLSYTDAHGDTTTSTYDTFGRLAARSGPLGSETFLYDNYSRLIEQQLNGVAYARPHYDQFSRIDHVDYPAAGQLKLTLARDMLGRTSGMAYRLGTASQPSTPAVVRSHSSGSISSGALTLTKPAGTVNGDLLVMTASADLSAAEVVTYTVAAGWTPLLPLTRSDPSSAGVNLQAWYKIANNEPASYTVTPDHANLIGGSIVRVDGHNPTNPFNTSNVVASLTGEAAVPSATTTVDNALVLRLVTWDQSKTLVAAPAGQTSLYHVDVNGHDNWGGYATQATAGSTGIAQFDLSSGAPYVGLTVAVTPASGTGSSTIDVTDTVGRSQSGQVLTNTTSAGAASSTWAYQYDSADRLTVATNDQHRLEYSFDAPTTCSGGTNPNSHKNSNRTAFNHIIAGVPYRKIYCYDAADRLQSSDDASAAEPLYDTHGNTTRLGLASGLPLRLYYDSSDRNRGFEQYDANGSGVGLYYDRDVQGRVIGRQANDILTWNWQASGEWYYGFTGIGDAPDIVRNASWGIIEKSLVLPGVLLTIRPGEVDPASKATYSLRNIHGDVLLTTNALGHNSSNGSGPANSYTYDPFGSILPGSTFPSNTASGSHAYVGQHQKLSETAFALRPIQMGARVYFPSLGRFAQVDPVEGGTENAYVYPADPVNKLDLSGTIAFFALYFAPPVAAAIGRVAVGALVSRSTRQVVAKQVGPQVVKQSVGSTTRAVASEVGRVAVGKPREALNRVRIELSSGKTPGIQIMGPGTRSALRDPLYQPPWVKMSVPGKELGVPGWEVHYMLQPASGQWGQLKIQ